MDPKKLETLLYQARAKIIWGRSEESVRDMLTAENVEPQIIDETIRIAQSERLAELRKKGIRNIVGGAICIVPGAGVFMASGNPGRIGGLLYFLVLVGIYFLIDGLYKIFKGKDEKGGLND